MTLPTALRPDSAELTVNQNYAGTGHALISFGASQILVIAGGGLIDAGDFVFA